MPLPAWATFWRRPPADYVDELLGDARALVTFGRWMGRADNDRLLTAIADVEAMAAPRLVGPKVIALEAIVAQRMTSVPPDTLMALRQGWVPHQSRLLPALKVYAIVGIALFTALVTGSLTAAYNDGLDIVRTLESLSTIETRTTFNRLVRDIDQAERQADRALPIEIELLAPPEGTVANPLSNDDPQSRAAQFDLARNVYFDGEAQLMDLSSRISLAVKSSDRFTQTLDRRALGLPTIRCQLFRLWHRGTLASLADEDAPGSSDPDFLRAFAEACPADVAMVSVRVGAAGYPQGLPDGAGSSEDTSRLGVLYRCLDRAEERSAALSDATGIETSIEGDDGRRVGSFVQYRSRLDVLVEKLRCRNVTEFSPEEYPLMANELREMRDALRPLGGLYLPALYGAVGALLATLRPAIQPLTPNPPWPRIIFRSSFGALAGVILVWFLAPGTTLAGELMAFGLSLFGLAFLMGFSLDLFFSLFDRLRELTDSAIRGTNGGTGGTGLGAGSGSGSGSGEATTVAGAAGSATSRGP